MKLSIGQLLILILIFLFFFTDIKQIFKKVKYKFNDRKKGT